jgi:pyruvate,water dikinase
MGLLYNFLKVLLSGKRHEQGASGEQLRNAFKERYHQFKLLLNANNKALEVMAEMAEALGGTTSFGMTFVRSRCTAVSTNVFQMIKYLNELHPGKYALLYERFKEIQQNINPFLRTGVRAGQGSLAVSLKEVDRSLIDQVGSKMANLGEIANRLHLEVPKGFVLTTSAYERFMQYSDLQAEIDRLTQSSSAQSLDRLYGLSSAIQQMIVRARVPEELAQAIREHYRQLENEMGKGVTVAMRSSAIGEDLVGVSFAGQYRSELNVSGENLPHAYKEIIASKYSVQAMAYRLNRGIRDEDVAMCVGCLCMVDALCGGVLYTRNPLNIRDDTAVINAAWGLPKAVVEGSVTPDLYLISREMPLSIRKKQVSIKERKFVCFPEEGLCLLDETGEESRQPSLTDEQALGLARKGLEVEAHYLSPQDIEWAIAKDGSILLIQCRPLKQMPIKETSHRKEPRLRGMWKVVLRGGITASPGVAAGPVFIVRKDVDLLNFPREGVLVTELSLPRWAALLNRASALVAQQGSVASHLACVAREFGVPAIFGLNGAMDLLENGRWITVDADGLTIYEGRIEELLKGAEDRRNLMEGSPVFEALSGAVQHIIPLNLMDPGAPFFRPQHCRTFHDITRFCHEKAVHEMFQFGRDHHFPERSSKQLLCHVPMKWWVLNLDDGFEQEVQGRYVKLENICSIPMLALWEGITAVPWAGPPPIDGKGFMSVMFKATTNTALVTGMRSRYGERNYFMISKNYCSLTSRLGFHFSLVEALVSDRPAENYISFQFKGGAADDERKHIRVLLVREILTEYGFRVEVQEDHLIARLEDRDEQFMQGRLRLLGYLTIHTRQLDMIMANQDSVSYYRSKINADIEALVGPP